MQLRELILEGVVGLPEPTRIVMGPGHVVIRWPGDLCSILLSRLYQERGEALEEGDATLVADLPDGSSLSLGGGHPGGAAAPLPPLSVFEALFVLRREEGAVLSQREAAGREQGLRALEAELQAAEEVERLEGEVDRWRHEVFGLEDGLRRLQEAEAAAARAEAHFSSFREGIEGLPQKVRTYQQARAKKEEREGRLRKELEAIPEVEGGVPPPLRWIVGGAALGVLSFVAAFLSPWRELALLAIPSFGVSAFLLLGMISRTQEAERAQRRRSFLAGKAEEIEAAWEEASADVQRLMEELEVESADGLLEWQETRDAAKAAAEEAAQALSALREDPGLRSAQARKKELESAIEETEEKLTLLVAGIFRTPAEVRQELEDLRGRLQAGTGQGMGDPSARALDAATAYLGAERSALLRTVGARASQLLAALTQGAWKTVGWGASGGLACKGEAGVSTYPDLDPEDREAARAAFSFAMAEAAAKRGQGLLFVDRAFDRLSGGRASLHANALKWLGQQGVQIIHQSDVSVFWSAADTTWRPA